MADTFIGGMGHPGSPIRVAASMEETFARLPSPADRRRLRLIVGVLGRRSGTFLLTGRPMPFHRWPREQRVAVMASWSTSRLAFRRQLFQVFKRLSLLAFLGDTEDGGTVINYTTSFRSPDWLRDEWAQRYGLAAFATDEYTSSLDAVYERLGVNVNHSRVSARERVLERGLRQLGWHVGYMPRNVQGCTQDERCGFCGYGCQIGAKQSTLKTYLMDAYRRRARIVVNCTVDRVLIEGGRAVGVRATVRQPEMPAFTLIVRSRAVVAAAGAIHRAVDDD